MGDPSDNENARGKFFFSLGKAARKFQAAFNLRFI